MVLGVRTTYPEISPSPRFSCLCEVGIHSFKLDLGTLSSGCQETIGIFPLLHGGKQQAGVCAMNRAAGEGRGHKGCAPRTSANGGAHTLSAVSLKRAEPAGINLWWYQAGDRLSTLEWFWALVTRCSKETGSDAKFGVQFLCILIWRFSSFICRNLESSSASHHSFCTRTAKGVRWLEPTGWWAEMLLAAEKGFNFDSIKWL